MPSSTRKITLVVYNSSLFPAHWGLFVPSEANPDVGTLIHAVGDAKSGFQTEFKRNYNLGTTTRSHKNIVLDHVKSEFVVDSPANAPNSQDRTPKDEIERVALSIRPPGPNLQDSKAEVGSLITINEGRLPDNSYLEFSDTERNQKLPDMDEGCYRSPSCQGDRDRRSRG
jgi:hypothetical protein